MSIGRKYLDELHARIVAEREAEHVTCRCAWCDWTHTGTLLDARAAHAEHRADAHPERTVKRRKTRHRRSHTLVAGKTLDENIAGARAQGANGSDTPPSEPAAEPEPEPDEPAPRTPIAAAAPTRCHADGCTMPPRYHRGQYAGLCHEHRNHALRRPKEAA